MSKLLFLGDFFYDYNEIRHDIRRIAEYIKNNNYDVILNLEGSVKTDTPLKKWINLYNSDYCFELLEMMNAKAVCLANNHVLDWKEKGLIKLINNLHNYNIQYFGVGRNLADSLQPAIIDYNGVKYGFIAFGWDFEMCKGAKFNKMGVAPLKEKIIKKAIINTSTLVDKVIVSLHMGYEYEKFPLPIHRHLSHKIIDWGAKLIIGHHPHVIQAYEVYKKKHIYYGLGNFYFGSMRGFYKNLNNEFILNETSKGMGVIYDLTKDTFNFIGIKYEVSNDQSSISTIEKPKSISGIDMEHYNVYFKINRTSSEKPSLFYPRHNIVIFWKMRIHIIKKTIIGTLFVFLKKVGLFRPLRKCFKKEVSK